MRLLSNTVPMAVKRAYAAADFGNCYG